MKPKQQGILDERNRIPSNEEWARSVQAELHRYKKHMREHLHKGDAINKFDLTEAMARRRKQAILNTMPEIYRRYRSPENGKNLPGEAWRDLNLCFQTYAQIDAQSHILFAASIWILDQVTKKEGFGQLYRLLPKEEELLDELCLHDVWHAKYGYDLISSVEYVLHHRNPVETDGDGFDRVLTSDYLAKKSLGIGNVQQSQNRKNYEDLIEMIPKEAVHTAVGHFRTYFWEWTDRFFSGAESFMQADAEYYKKTRDTQIVLSHLENEVKERLSRIMKSDKKKKKRPLREKPYNPLLVDPKMNFPELLNPMGMQKQMPPYMEEAEEDEWRLLDECKRRTEQMSRLGKSLDANVEKLDEVGNNLRKYEMQMVEGGRIFRDDLTDYGEISVSPMEPMKISDPYEMCFALLYLTEADDDLPWLYGVGCGLMKEVADTLPWGIVEFDEMEDDIFMDNHLLKEPAALPKSIVIPDWFERSYRSKNEELDFPRNLAQIVYEETGCILPENLHIYNERAKTLGKYGVRGKDAAWLLMLMSTLATARRSLEPLNLDWIDEKLQGDASDSAREEKKDDLPKELQTDMPAGEAEKLKEEIRQLKKALYASDKENREMKKKLASQSAAADREHRELADLREYVFNHTENVEEEEEADESKWPYEVKKDTLIFGGHAAWVKGLRNLLTGKVRFIDKNLVFDTGIIKHAEVIWIQPNALAHKMYYRIMDAARALDKAVRYFTFASWAKCADQLMAGDLEE